MNVTGSWAVAWARRAKLSEAALPNDPLAELAIFSIPIPKVATNFFTKLKVCGVMVASATDPRFSNAIA